MANKMLGINKLATASTTPVAEPGIVVEDPVGKSGQYTFYDSVLGASVTRKYTPGGRYKYVKALGTITAGDAVKLDITATAAERDWSVIRTAAADERIEGIAMVSATTGQYLWIQIAGRFNDANVTDASVAGAVLGTTTTAGRLGTVTPSATNAYMAALGRGVYALTDGSASNLADVEIAQ